MKGACIRMNEAFEKILESLEVDAIFYNTESDIDQNHLRSVIKCTEKIKFQRE